MRQRLVLFNGCLALVLMLAFPLAAHAGGTWSVKNSAEKAIGSATSVSTYGAVAGRISGGHYFKTAGVEYLRMYAWRGWCKSSSGLLKDVIIQKLGSRWVMGPPHGQWVEKGRVIRSGGRRLVQQANGTGWRTRGSVAGACPAWLAGAAVYLLLGKEWR